MHDSRHTSKTHANLFNRLSFSPFASLNSFRAFSASVQKKIAYHYINYYLAKRNIVCIVKVTKNSKSIHSIDQLQNSVTAPSRNMETRLVMQKQKDIVRSAKKENRASRSSK